MPSDLTERLVAKLEEVIFDCPRDHARWVANLANHILPLLLSEPKLVAGLPEAVRIDLLCQLTSDETRLKALTPRERAVMKLGEAVSSVSGTLRLDLSYAVESALAEVKALTPEVGK